MNPFVKRQLRTTFLLLLALALILSAAFYMRWSNSFVSVSAPTGATEEDIAQALIRYKSLPDSDAAQLRTTVADPARMYELAFTGLPTSETTQSMTALLSQKGTHAAFYLTLAEVTNYSDSIALLLEDGCSVGILNSSAAADPELLVEQLCRPAVTLRARHGITCTQLLSAAQPDSASLKAAAAAGMEQVICTPYQIALADCASVENAAALLQDIPQGSIIQVRIDRRDTSSVAELEHLLQAMDAADPYTACRALLDTVSDEDLPAPMQRVYTSERAVCLTFSGLGNSSELTLLLDALDALNAKAAFFVDHLEAQAYPEDIRRILDAGHELGIKPADDLEEDEVQLLYQLTLAEKALKENYGCEGPLLVRSGLGRPSHALTRAAAAGGYTLISNILTPVQAGDERAASAEAVLAKTLPEGKRTLQRGEILHFRMSFYRSDSLLSDLVTSFLTRRSVYPAKALSEVLGNEALRYAYPLTEETILPEVHNRIHAGQLTQDVMSIFPQRYVGTDWINSEATLPGFTSGEISQLDTLGLIPNKDNMVFLTFDDWGSDANLTRILDVLASHNAKATFFVYTENVVNNPNLLRAIAAEGHAIASHTHRHVPLSNAGEKEHTFVSLDAQQVADLQADLIDSYRTMQEIVGDISINGVPALTPYFRPPTLALSRAGVETVYDAGFTWIVSGSCSTDDYIATSVEGLVSNMLAGTQSGAVLVMHMTDSSVYTADALDAYLTQLEAGEVQYRFATLTEALN